MTNAGHPPANLVYLVRHGQTALNAEARLRGLSDPPLDDVGLAEVDRLGSALASKKPALVISSPLQRAITTAEAIARAAGVQTISDQRLNDRDYGRHTGAVIADVVREFGSIDAAPGVESMAAVATRIANAFAQLLTEYGPGPLVLVSHDATNKALLASIDSTLVDVGQRTACWNELRLVEGQWQVASFDQKPGAD
ncbi:MAG: histidine phosphatase family protein [Antricoccus sp.]